eukprot:5070637-Prymnesium_polylepis.1
MFVSARWSTQYGGGVPGDVTSFSFLGALTPSSKSNAAEWRRPLCLTFEAELILRAVSCLDF